MVTLCLMVKTEPKHEITNTANDHGLTAQKTSFEAFFLAYVKKKLYLCTLFPH